MKKVICAALAVGAVALAAGCGSAGNDHTTTVVEKVAPPIEATPAVEAPVEAPPSEGLSSSFDEEVVETLIAEEPTFCAEFLGNINAFGRGWSEEEFVVGWFEATEEEGLEPGYADYAEAEGVFDAAVNVCRA